MSHHEENFADLRQLLEQKPSEEVWGQLIRQLDQWDDPTVLHEVVVPYTQEHLAHWDDRLRTTPQRWAHHARQYLAGTAADNGLFSLGRSFYLGNAHDKNAEMTLVCSELFACYTELTIHFQKWCSADTQRLIKHGLLSQIKHFAMIWCGLTDEDLALFEAVPWQLHSLDLAGNELTDQGLSHFLLQPSMQSLKKLDIGYIEGLGIGTMRALQGSQIRLRELAVESCDSLDREAYGALVQGAAFGTLEVLETSSVKAEGGIGAVLTSSPYTPPLKSLDIAFCEVNDDDIVRLAQWPALSTLEKWEVTYHEITAPGVQALVESPYLGKLHYLDLGCSQALTDEAFAMLLQAPWLKQLTYLRLWSSEITPARAAILASCRQLTALQTLSLWHNPLGLQGIQQLLPAAHFPALLDLNLAECGLGDEGLSYIATTPWHNQINALTLDENQISASGVAALLQSPYMPGLEQLSLSQNPLQGLAHSLSQITQPLHAFKVLQLDRCSLTLDDIQALGESLETNTQLHYLDLSHNPIGDAGLQRLLSQILPNKTMKSLSLENCQLTETSAEFLLELAPSLRDTHLYLGNNAIEDPQLRQRLQERLGVNFTYLGSMEPPDITRESGDDSGDLDESYSGAGQGGAGQE